MLGFIGYTEKDVNNLKIGVDTPLWVSAYNFQDGRLDRIRLIREVDFQKLLAAIPLDKLKSCGIV